MAVSLCLASASPRRRDLLASIGVEVLIRPVDIDETYRDGEAPRDYVLRLAREKARAAAAGTHLPVLGSDTAVVLGGRVLGKPRDRVHFNEMLSALSGNTHEVMTGVAVQGPAGLLEACVVTQVTLGKISEDEIAAYWETGEPADKAGGYAIQGLASVFVEYIQGSYSGVVGLPLFETAALLRLQGVPLWSGGGAAVS